MINNKFIHVFLRNPLRTYNKAKKVFKKPKLKFKFSPAYYSHSLIAIVATDIGWKDKFDTPRFEIDPYIWIHFWKWDLMWYWEADDQYWEQLLWYVYYTQGLPYIFKARNTWPWEDMEGNSTWEDKYLKHEI